MNPTQVRKAANSKMTLIDQVRIALQEQGEREVHFNLADFASSHNMETMPFYQALYRLNKNKEIEIMTEVEEKNGRRRIVGVRLNKLEAPEFVIARAMSKPADTSRIVRKSLAKIQDQVPALTEYRSKKTVVDNIRKELQDAGFDPIEVLHLPAEDALAEEGLFLYDELCNAQSRIVELEAQILLMQRVSTIAKEPIIDDRITVKGEPVLVMA